MDEARQQVSVVGAVRMNFLAMDTLIVNLNKVSLEYPVNFVFNFCC
eukprot:SAG22_NODE_86_length_21440_cov_288.248700_8_plen_46_part_00